MNATHSAHNQGRIAARLLLQIAVNRTTDEDIIRVWGKDNMWTTEQLREQFEVHDFLAPLVFVTRKADQKSGVLLFRHSPRIYFGFQED